jgi:arsenate reductase (thioredoxin)
MTNSSSRDTFGAMMTPTQPHQSKPRILFVCVHNAGRSQMAAGFMSHLGQGRVEVLSAGSAPKDSINPVAVEAMAEIGIDISNNSPKVLTNDAVEQSDAVITMGCGDVCPFYPGKRYEDWVLDDPAGQGIESVRVIRDEIKVRVETLLAELLG